MEKALNGTGGHAVYTARDRDRTERASTEPEKGMIGTGDGTYSVV